MAFMRVRVVVMRCGLAVCGAACLAACSSSGRLLVTEPAAGAVNGYDTVLIRVSSEIDNAKKEAIQLEATTAMIAREQLRFQRVFTHRQSPGATADLRVEATLVRKHAVKSKDTAGMRRARVVADVVLIETKTNGVIARFTAEGWAGDGGTTEEALRRTAEQIVRFLAANGSVTSVS